MMKWTDRDEFARRAANNGGNVTAAWLMFPMFDMVRRLSDHMATFADRLHTVAWERYEEAGRPFGDTDEDMRRWTRRQRELQD